VLDALEAERAGESRRGALEFRLDVAAHTRLAREPADAQHALGAVRLQVGSADEAVAGQEWKDVVAVRPLVLAFVHLDHVPEPEKAIE
jgi:phage terminase Nu1 subunit (DNA packaging protein)